MIFLQLFLAHILTDFVFQTSKGVKQKQKKKAKSIFLYLHAFLAGFLSYLLLRDWDQIFVPIVISVTHYVIDLWKLNQKKDNLKYFLLDQLLHIIIIIIVWLYLSSSFEQIGPGFIQLLDSNPFLSVLIAYLLIIFPVGFIIGKATEKWHDEILNNTKEPLSLKAAGRYIGIFERILVLTFILTDNFSAIGFLIAAKSILRFADKNEASARKQTEYVLIGTLMSFSITIIIGLLVRHIAF
ncbi:MAG: DUF3307 domain-containing protein [Zunongwangia sp.]|uniref:Membrane protein n=4 Tax=Zunongwangia profunda TaxID=398743 RepID=D5BF25_ZUNPS|nr:DUF3307 domain-containing protein [Zunongwangia profunda]ADF52923.1 membrane protein [Zunongwangia profunda SM-A87]MAS72778.1 DUF3307 domain-containing protein [Zunongwangia sp.]HCV80837.1 DUF3307 domain-containing protein [Zunongwangia profunda]|tara:strand:- start:715 stop:1434 length:720 start_codon:yes stop_codon:yes gene_type:complete